MSDLHSIGVSSGPEVLVGGAAYRRPGGAVVSSKGCGDSSCVVDLRFLLGQGAAHDGAEDQVHDVLQRPKLFSRSSHNRGDAHSTIDDHADAQRARDDIFVACIPIDLIKHHNHIPINHSGQVGAATSLARNAQHVSSTSLLLFARFRRAAAEVTTARHVVHVLALQQPVTLHTREAREATQGEAEACRVIEAGGAQRELPWVKLDPLGYHIIVILLESCERHLDKTI